MNIGFMEVIVKFILLYFCAKSFIRNNKVTFIWDTVEHVIESAYE